MTSLEDFVFYYNEHSLCSSQVRVTYALRGPPKDGSELQLVSRHIDIGQKAEQLQEEYLCKVNREGLVPVLVNKEVLGGSMTESVTITLFMCDTYPQLLPSKHEWEIKQLLSELHNISYYALSFAGLPAVGIAHLARIDDLLKQDLSDKYRAALEYKKTQRLLNEQKILPTRVAQAEDQTRIFLAKIDQIKKARGEKAYIHGPKPTALDAHVLVFLCRLEDKKRMDLIPESLHEYLQSFRSSGVLGGLISEDN